MAIKVNDPIDRTACLLWMEGWDIFELSNGMKWARKQWLMTERWASWVDVLIDSKILEKAWKIALVKIAREKEKQLNFKKEEPS